MHLAVRAALVAVAIERQLLETKTLQALLAVRQRRPTIIVPVMGMPAAEVQVLTVTTQKVVAVVVPVVRVKLLQPDRLELATAALVASARLLALALCTPLVVVAALASPSQVAESEARKLVEMAV